MIGLNELDETQGGDPIEILLDLPVLKNPIQWVELNPFSQWVKEKISCPVKQKLALLFGELFVKAGGIGSSRDPFSSEILSEEKIKSFFHKLDKQASPFNEELLKNRDFIRCCISLGKGLKKERMSRKIEFYSRLLDSATNLEKPLLQNKEDFEACLNFLHKFSFEEFQALEIFEKISRNSNRASEVSELAFMTALWEDVSRILRSKFKINPAQLGEICKKFADSGCLKQIGDHPAFLLTPRYFQFKGILGLGDRF